MSQTAEAARVCAVDAQVVANRSLCREHVQIDVELPGFPPSRPGQFLQLRCADADGERSRGLVCGAAGQSSRRKAEPCTVGVDFREQIPFLRRPFSIADRVDADAAASDPQSKRGLRAARRVRLSIISRAVGPGTRWLERLRPGDSLNLTGPLGRGFQIPQPDTAIVLVAGGVGIPPLLYLARELHARGRTNVYAIFGATTRELLPLRLVDEPARDATPRPCVALPGDAPYPAIITSDDGSIGLRGYATDGLVEWRRRNPHAAACVMACGPSAMLRTVARRTRQLELDCQLCIERTMGCGMGTCLSCVVRVRDPAPPGWRYALACSAGPVFPRDELLDCADAPCP